MSNAQRSMSGTAGWVLLTGLLMLPWASPAQDEAAPEPQLTPTPAMAPAEAEPMEAADAMDVETADVEAADAEDVEPITLGETDLEPERWVEGDTNAPAPTMDIAERVTINVNNGELSQVLNAFSRQTGQSIVIGPDVQATVTMRLSGVPWREALEVILEPHGFTYRELGRTIIISKKETAAEIAAAPLQPTISKVFVLKYIDAVDIKDTIEQELSPVGRMSILTTRGMQGWEFESSTGGKAKGGASNLGKRKRAGTSEDRATSKMVLVNDLPSAVARITDILAQVDRMPVQILIEARFVEVDSDLLRDSGLEVGTGATGAQTPGAQGVGVRGGNGNVYAVGGQSISGGVSPANFSANSSSISGSNPFNTGLSLVFQQLTDVQFQMILHMMEEDVRANILSSPRVLVLNNQEAAIIVGTKFPIIKSEISGDSATISTSLEY